ncbi:MAG: CDP-alcohol phosphatidyltransferase family protein [candidate division Zixibacteria bacterium]|nr:CDP-alcohol phosphatidyltransferase family protein [candidate division Zixibacteria bacterium]MBU1470904.1 CDP-alcohol phosphatidyltransferase family protein [candidate division Zixibacteria bacterium]MBU2624282.1 CDP-alcohol phosphatidyltransferase family protein [candidate division Zixibacteria bacterium]
MIDWEKAEKLPPEHRYLNISSLWIFYYRSVVKILYKLRVPHEVVTIFSIACGVVAAILFYDSRYILAAIALHFKDIFDACDGSLARLTGRGHLIGRYLDSVGDFFSLALVIIAIVFSASRSGSDAYMLWGVATILSVFIQCSFFNYYQLAYLEIHGVDRLLSRRNETTRDDLNGTARSVAGKLLVSFLRFCYLIIYSWQDRLVAAIDKSMLKGSGASERNWYGDRLLMVPQSALCFGTHIFVIIVFSIVNKPEYSLIFISTVMNIFLVSLLLIRRYRFRLKGSRIRI